MNGAVVARHVTRESCWYILQGHVWDVTDYLDKHSGSASVILSLDGKDAIQEFDRVHQTGTPEENPLKRPCLGGASPRRRCWLMRSQERKFA